MIMNGEHSMIWKEAVLARLKAAAWHSSGETEENQETPM